MQYTPHMTPGALSRLKNSQLPCKALGCQNLRRGLCSHCGMHQSPWQRLGDVQQRAVGAKEWAPYREQVKAIFDGDPGHQGLAYVLKWLQALIDQAKVSPQAFHGAEELDRLARGGASGLDMVLAVCACWCLAEQRPGIFKSDRAREFGLARAMFSLVPRPVKVSRTTNPTTGQKKRYGAYAKPSALAHMGQLLRGTLAPFLAMVAHTVKTRPDAEAAIVDAMRQPFKPPAVAYMNEGATTAKT